MSSHGFSTAGIVLDTLCWGRGPVKCWAASLTSTIRCQLHPSPIVATKYPQTLPIPRWKDRGPELRTTGWSEELGLKTQDGN